MRWARASGPYFGRVHGAPGHRVAQARRQQPRQAQLGVLAGREVEALAPPQGGHVDPLGGVAGGDRIRDAGAEPKATRLAGGVWFLEGVGAEHRRVDEAREDRREGDPLRLQLGPGGLGDRRQGRLAAAVGGLVRHPDQPREAGDRGHVPAAAPRHRRRQMRQQHQVGQRVDGEVVARLAPVEGQQGLGPVEAGAGDQQVDVRMLGDQLARRPRPRPRGRRSRARASPPPPRPPAPRPASPARRRRGRAARARSRPRRASRQSSVPRPPAAPVTSAFSKRRSDLSRAGVRPARGASLGVARGRNPICLSYQGSTWSSSTLKP